MDVILSHLNNSTKTKVRIKKQQVYTMYIVNVQVKEAMLFVTGGNDPCSSCPCCLCTCACIKYITCTCTKGHMYKRTHVHVHVCHTYMYISGC